MLRVAPKNLSAFLEGDYNVLSTGHSRRRHFSAESTKLTTFTKFMPDYNMEAVRILILLPSPFLGEKQLLNPVQHFGANNPKQTWDAFCRHQRRRSLKMGTVPKPKQIETIQKTPCMGGKRLNDGYWNFIAQEQSTTISACISRAV